ncbi:hypothetical protein WI87_10775 [Burkholderia ubonensis]|nr:hypothetical protein WI87_10775 [Burkholderia ubonensis]
MLLATLLSLATLFTSPVSAANTPQLSDQERNIMDYIDSRKDEQIDFLAELVNINGGTRNIEGICKVGELLVPEFESAGFATRWIHLPPEMQRAPTLVAERKGASGKRLLLIGHLDTVFPEDGPFQKYERHGNTATGPGIIDNKGGLVVILYALKALHAVQALRDASISVVLTGDEENNGKPTSISRRHLVEFAKESDVVLDFEPTIRDHASIGRRGTAHWLITANGREGHSSIIFSKEVGDGAVLEMARILNDMLEVMSGEPGLTFNPGIVVGGVQASYEKMDGQGSAFGRTNLVARKAIASGDVRYQSASQRDRAKARMESILQKPLPGTNATLQFEEVLPPMKSTDDSSRLFEKYSMISEKLGYGKIYLLSADLRGGGDISYVSPYVTTSLVGIGANGSGEHSSQETLDVDSLFMQSQRAALLMLDLIRPKNTPE